jgi:hypothetical protein
MLERAFDMLVRRVRFGQAGGANFAKGNSRIAGEG